MSSATGPPHPNWSWTLLFVAILLVVIVVVIIVIVLSAQGSRFFGGSSIGDNVFFQLNSSQTGNFYFKDFNTELTLGGTYSFLNTGADDTPRYLQINTGNAIIDNQVLFLDAGVGNEGVVFGSLKGGAFKDIVSLCVAYPFTKANAIYPGRILNSSSLLTNVLYFSTHLGGIRFGWARLSTPSSSRSKLGIQEQLGWPFVQYYNMWNATGSFGFTGPVELPLSNCFDLQPSSFDTAPYGSSMDGTSKTADPIVVYRNSLDQCCPCPRLGLGIQYESAFANYFPQGDYAPVKNATYRLYVYTKTGVVTTPTPPSSETPANGIVTIGSLYISATGIPTLFYNSASIVFDHPLIPLTSSAPWSSLESPCDGFFTANDAPAQSSSLLQRQIWAMFAGNLVALGLYLNPFTASANDTNPAYQYLYAYGQLH